MEMMKLSVHFKPKHKYDSSSYEVVAVERVIDGHAVVASGSMEERNTLDGGCLVPVIRWQVDGRRVNKLQLYQMFGVEV